jgi:hypothetical protein
MNSTTAPEFAYIASDLGDRQTLRDFGRACAAGHATEEGPLKRAAHGLHLRPGSLRRPRPTAILRAA